VACDHTADPDPASARWQHEIECARDISHARGLTPGELVDLFARAGLGGIRLEEEQHQLDFDEWFDRGTPGRAKAEVRAALLAGCARGFSPEARADGGVTIHLSWSLVRGVRPA